MRKFAESWPDPSIVQRTVAQILWRSNLTLLDKLNNPETRQWCAEKTLEWGWGKDMLAIQIATRLHEQQGKAISNFEAALPPTDSDMAAQVFKNPYIFDFRGAADPRREAELGPKLIDHIQRFLLEPGRVSQLNFYLNVVDDLLRHPDDKPSIGLLLVRDKNRTVV